MTSSNSSSVDIFPSFLNYRLSPEGQAIFGPSPNLEDSVRSNMLMRGHWRPAILLKVMSVIKRAGGGRRFVETCPRCGHPPFLAPPLHTHACPICSYPRRMIDTINGLCDCANVSSLLGAFVGIPELDDILSFTSDATKRL